MKTGTNYSSPTDDDLGYYKKAYDLGYQAASSGLSEKDNPYPTSGHERDTTFDDELHYQWYSGFWAASSDSLTLS